MAIDFVTMAVLGEYDVGILMSTDTDLKPALEAVCRLTQHGMRAPRAEVASWSGEGQHNRRLSVPGRQIWCHWIEPETYWSVADATDYAKPL